MRRSASSASSANLQELLHETSAVREEVIARAPPADPEKQVVIVPPKTSLKPSHLVSTWQRWSSVAQELAGKKTQQQLMQVGTIGVVILLRTLLQVCDHIWHSFGLSSKQARCMLCAGALWLFAHACSSVPHIMLFHYIGGG